MRNNIKNSKPYESEMTYSQANALNKYYGKEGPTFMASIGTEENPEFLYPEELKESSIKAFNSPDEERNFKVDQYLKELSRRKAENPLANYLAGLVIGVPTAGTLQGLMPAAQYASGIKTAGKNTWNATKHVVKSAINPMNAYTGVGQAAGITSDIYWGYKSLKNAARIIDKWRNGEFDHQDIPEFAVSASGTLPLINYGTNLYSNATNAFNTIKQINQTKKISTSDYDDLVRTKAMSNDYVNAPGNSEAIYTNPLEATIYNKQITNQLSSKAPSKLTKAELEGVPRGERNNIDRVMEKVKSEFSIGPADPSYVGSFQTIIASDAAKAINAGNAKSLVIRPDLKDYNWNAINDRIKMSFLPANKSVDKIKLFANQLNDLEVSPAFSNVDNNVNHMTALYRGYLRKLGYQSSNLTDDEVSKLLQYHYNQLNGNISGVGKDLILYHGVGGGYRQPLEQYNLLDQGTFTNNIGRSGPGFYFSNIPAYSGVRSEYNIQPYLINNLDNAMSAKDLGYTGYVGQNIKSYVTDLDYLTKSMGVSKKELVSRFQKLLPDESKTLVVDPFESAHSTLPGFHNNSSIDFRYRGPSQNIKSLFPHPDRFVEQLDGTVKLSPTNWHDPRFNFKQGGKILKWIFDNNLYKN